MPKRTCFASDSLLLSAKLSFNVYNSCLPYPFGHHRRGFCTTSCENSADDSFTELFPGASEISLLTFVSPNEACSVPLTAVCERFSSGTVISISARLVSGKGSLVTTCGSAISTTFVAVKVTGCQIPVSRSRIAGTQSQPSVATNVGPSRHMAPPFSPGPPLIDCSCGMPGCGGGDTRTASVFIAPAFTTLVTSNTPRINAPVMVPSDCPFNHTTAL